MHPSDILQKTSEPSEKYEHNKYREYILHQLMFTEICTDCVALKKNTLYI